VEEGSEESYEERREAGIISGDSIFGENLSRWSYKLGS